MIWHSLRQTFSSLIDRFTAWSGFDRALLQDQIQQRALEVTSQLQQGQWANVRQQFVNPLQWILSEQLLKRGWGVVCTTAGSPQEIISNPVITRRWGLTTVKVPIRFTRTKLVMVLRMVPTGGLIGLRFGPYHSAGFGSDWQYPAYAVSENVQEQDVEIGVKGNTVGATLCLPSADKQYPCPCIVLIPGSGPCDRDATVGASKPFKDLAMGLASRGIAVLRFEKATFANQRRFRKSTSITLEQEYMDHAIAAICYCTGHSRILSKRVYVLGHSLGAWVTPRIAEMEAEVAGCIIMAGPSQPYYHNAIRQLRYLFTLEDSPQEHIAEQIHELETQVALADSPELDLSTPASKLPFNLGPSYWLSCRSFDPIATCQQSEKPILVLQGSRDYQVTVNDDFCKWRSGLRDKVDVKFKIYNGLNHLFITGSGLPNPSEYDVPGHVDEEVIQDISAWITEQPQDGATTLGVLALWLYA